MDPNLFGRGLVSQLFRETQEQACPVDAAIAVPKADEYGILLRYNEDVLPMKALCEIGTPVERQKPLISAASHRPVSNVNLPGNRVRRQRTFDPLFGQDNVAIQGAAVQVEQAE